MKCDEKCLSCGRPSCVWDDRPDDDTTLNDIARAFISKYQRDHHERNIARYREKQRAIKEARKARGWRQEDLARLIGVSRSALSEWETGRERADWERLYAVLPELKEETK